MVNDTKARKSSTKHLEIIWLAVLILLMIGGLYFVIERTNAAAVGRYISPPNIFLGVVLLYVFSVVLAYAIVNEMVSFSFLIELRKSLIHKLNEANAEKLRNMALLLMFFMVAFSMTESSNLRIPSFAKTIVFGLFVNIFSAMVSLVGVFGWAAYLFLSRNTREKS